MLKLNYKGLLTAMGCASALALAGAGSLPRQASNITGSGGYHAACLGENSQGCYFQTEKSCSGGEISECQYNNGGSMLCYDIPNQCTGSLAICNVKNQSCH